MVSHHERCGEWGFADVKAAIWDNRCTAHCPTTDLVDGRGTRMGLRTISIAGKAFLDPDSESKLQSKRAKEAKVQTNGIGNAHA